jgi:predicted flap endonuclease-1-like 5' DNA nuclease
VIDPKATYLYNGVAYGPGQHDTMPEAAKSAIAKRAEGSGQRAAAASVDATDPLAELVGDPKLATALRETGYGDVAAIGAASDADLTKVKGVGEATLEKLRIAVAG